MFERKVMINHFNNNIFCKINLCSIWFNFSFDPMNRFGITLLKRVIIYTIYVLSNKLISKFPSIVFKWSFLTWTKTAMMSTEINLAKKLNSKQDSKNLIFKNLGVSIWSHLAILVIIDAVQKIPKQGKRERTWNL